MGSAPCGFSAASACATGGSCWGSCWCSTCCGGVGGGLNATLAVERVRMGLRVNAGFLGFGLGGDCTKVEVDRALESSSELLG